MRERGRKGLKEAQSDLKSQLFISKVMKKVAVSIVAACSLFMATGCSEIQEALEEHNAEQAEAEAEQTRIKRLDIDQPIAKLSVEAISKEFEDNSVMAENKYMNQPVELTGYIGSIDDSMFDEKNVSITITGGEYSFSSVSCSKPRSSPEVRELRKGMNVAVRGVVTSEEMGIGLSRCKFWSFSQDRWIGLQANSNSTKQTSHKQDIATNRTQQESTTQSTTDQQTRLNQNKEETVPECIVLDPNDTYANARTTPNGSIVGPLANGTRVKVIGELNDPAGRKWSEVSFGNAGTSGYVFKSLLTSCE